MKLRWLAVWLLAGVVVWALVLAAIARAWPR